MKSLSLGLVCAWIALGFFACSGTKASNPKQPTSLTYDLELGSDVSSSIASLSLCVRSVTFYPSGGGEGVAASISSSSVTANTTAIIFGTVTLPEGDYSRATMDLSGGCASGSNIRFTNGSGLRQSSEAITLTFAGALSASESLAKIQLGVESISEALVSVSTDSEIKATSESAPGEMRPQTILPYIADSYRTLTVNGSSLYFSGKDPMHGEELWRIDSSAGRAVLVKDLVEGSASSSPSSLTGFSNLLYFFAGGGFWRSDGTDAGTLALFTGTPAYDSPVLGCRAIVNGKLLFQADSAAEGYELWAMDLAGGAPYLLKDIYPGGTWGAPCNFAELNGVTYFVARGNNLNDPSLWKTDGTAAGTTMVSSTGVWGGIHISGGNIYFTESPISYALWKSDGTTAGTTLVKSVFVHHGSLTDVAGTLFFGAQTATEGSELWKSDGTTGGTTLVKDINPGSASSNADSITDVNGVAYFVADDGANGTELWKSDGTAAGTVLVKDINPGSGGSNPSELTNVGGVLYFRATDGVAGYELWKSDGTAAGTVLVKDICPGSGSSAIRSIVNFGGAPYFIADDCANGAGVWKSDGTAVGTVRVTQ